MSILYHPPRHIGLLIHHRINLWYFSLQADDMGRSILAHEIGQCDVAVQIPVSCFLDAFTL